MYQFLSGQEIACTCVVGGAGDDHLALYDELLLQQQGVGVQLGGERLRDVRLLRDQVDPLLHDLTLTFHVRLQLRLHLVTHLAKTRGLEIII